MTTTEQERAAYMAGDTDKAALLARIDALQRALGRATAALEAIADGTMTARQCAGAAAEVL
jgi:hypothetical protein